MRNNGENRGFEFVSVRMLDPFCGRGGEIGSVRAGEEKCTVRELCERMRGAKLPGCVKFSVDGVMADGGSDASDAKFEIAFWEVPEVDFAINVAIYIAIAMATNYTYDLLFGKKIALGSKYNSAETGESKTYSWEYESTNSVQEGAPIPVLYGRFLTTPPVVNSYVEDSNAEMSSFLLKSYAVADSGAGVNDIINFPQNEYGELTCFVNHNELRNYNSTSDNSGQLEPGLEYDFEGLGYINHFELDENGNEVAFNGFPHMIEADEHLDEMRLKTNTAQAFVKFTRMVISYNKSTGRTQKVEVYTRKAGEYELSNSVVVDSGEGGVNITVPINADYVTDSIKVVFLTKSSHGNWKKNRSVYVNRVELYAMTPESHSEIQITDRIRVSAFDGYESGETERILKKSSCTIDVDKRIDTGVFKHPTTKLAYPDKVAIHLNFPYGLYSVNRNSGETETETVKVNAYCYFHYSDGTVSERKKFLRSEFGYADGGIYISNDLETLTVTKSHKEDFTLMFENDFSGYSGFGSNVSYVDVEVKLEENVVSDEYHYNAVYLKHITESWNFQQDYIRTATADVIYRAYEELNKGSNPKFQILAERSTIYAYDGESWVERPGDNPAWAAYDMIVQPKLKLVGSDGDEHIELIRERFRHDEMIFDEFQDWADFCDENGIFCGLYCESQENTSKFLEHACTLGRASIVNKGGMIGVVIDAKWSRRDGNNNPVPCFLFDDSNIVKGTYQVSSMSNSEIVTEIECTFFDRERDYNRFTMIERDESFDRSDLQQNTRTITLYACTDRVVASDFAKYAIAQNKTRRNYKWTGDLDSMPCEIGDVVSVKGNLVRINATSFDSEMRRQFEGSEYVDGMYVGHESPSIVR